MTADASASEGMGRGSALWEGVETTTATWYENYHDPPIPPVDVHLKGFIQHITEIIACPCILLQCSQ